MYVQSKCKHIYIEAINLAVGFDMWPLRVTYTLSLTFIPFPGSFALLEDLKLALALALSGLLGVVTCIELAQLTLCHRVYCAFVCFKSIQFQLTFWPDSVVIAYDLPSLSEIIPTLNWFFVWSLYPTVLPTGNSFILCPLVSCCSCAVCLSTNLSEWTEVKLEILGSILPNFLPLSSNNDGVLPFNGVARYSKGTSLHDCFAAIHYFIRPLTVQMAHSAGLLLWW